MLDQYGPWVFVLLVYVIGGIVLYQRGRLHGRKEGYSQGYFDRAHQDDTHPAHSFAPEERVTAKIPRGG